MNPKETASCGMICVFKGQRRQGEAVPSSSLTCGIHGSSSSSNSSSNGNSVSRSNSISSSAGYDVTWSCTPPSGTARSPWRHAGPAPTRTPLCCLTVIAWTLLLTILLLGPCPAQAQGSALLGSCWRRLEHGQCGKLIKSGVPQEACCSGSSSNKRSWTSDLKPDHHSQVQLSVDHDDHLNQKLYNNSVIFDKPLCKPCSVTCEGVHCDRGQKCKLREGLPQCVRRRVCNQHCHLENKGPVCGSDGRTYASECHMLKRSCRKQTNLMISHNGPCQTCTGVRCGSPGKKCVLDERLVPECVRCPTKCPAPEPHSRPICGQDGKIYESSCHLKLAQCQLGKVIFRAYKGHCRENVTCKDVRCWLGQRCLTDPITGQPQCTSCGALESCQASSQKVCGSDGRTYTSWCALRHEACRSGYSIVTVPHKHCTREAKDKNCNRKGDKKHKDNDSKNGRKPKNIMDSKEVEEVILKTHQYEKVSKGPVAIILSENIKLSNGLEIKKEGTNNKSSSNSSSSSSASGSRSSRKKQKKSERRQQRRKRKGCKKNKRKHRRGKKSRKTNE